MPRKKFTDDSDGDDFETEAFQFLNENKEEANQDAEDSDENLLGGEDSDEEEEEDKNEDAESDDSDDEAPESIGFSDSRKSIMTQLKSAMKQVDQEKQKLKEKRKLKEVRFKEQKEKKMKYMHETRLPDEILESIDEVIPKNVKHRKKLEKDKQEEPTVKQTEKTEKSKRRRGNKDKDVTTTDLQTKEPDEYIPLVDNVSGVEVTDVSHFEKQHKSLAQKAADFRNSRLFGSGVQRISNKTRLLKSEKRKHRLR